MSIHHMHLVRIFEYSCSFSSLSVNYLAAADSVSGYRVTLLWHLPASGILSGVHLCQAPFHDGVVSSRQGWPTDTAVVKGLFIC